MTPTTRRMHLEEELAQGRQELLAAQLVVKQLSEKCSKLCQAINATTSITSLPLELTTNIFHLVDDANWDGDSLPLLSLGAVFAEWRNIILHTPSLWQNIRLPFDKVKYLNDTKLSTLEEWLSRGQQLPLSITLNLPDIPTPNSFNPHKDGRTVFWKLLMQHSRRWRDLVLKNPLPDLFDPMLFGGVGDLPLLRSFEVHCEFYHRNWPDDSEFENCFFSRAPLLRTVEFRGSMVSKMVFPWNQLEFLTVDGSLADIYSMLSKGENLTQGLFHCHLNSQDREFLFPVSQLERITVPKLQTLSIWEGCSLLEFLDLPALRDYRCRALPDDFDFDVLSRVSENPSFQLKRLYLDVFATWDESFMNCMRSLPFLEDLLLAVTQLPSIFIEALRCDRDDRTLLPNLEKLTCSGDTLFRFETLLATLVHRCQKHVPPAANDKGPVSQITDVLISSNNDIPGFDDVGRGKLVELQEAGVEIKVVVEQWDPLEPGLP